MAPDATAIEARSFPGGSTGLDTIATTPPALVGVKSDGHVLVQFQDALGGMSAASMMRATDSPFIEPNGSTDLPTSVTIPPDGGLPTDVVTVELTPGGNPGTPPRSQRITAAGVLDEAGKPLAINDKGGIAPASVLASSNPVVKVPKPGAKPAKPH